MSKKWKIGDKVVPIGKSVISKTSKVWERAEEMGQPYLVITDIRDRFIFGRTIYDIIIVCNRGNGDFGGDYFKPDELIPFEGNNEHYLTLLHNKGEGLSV